MIEQVSFPCGDWVSLVSADPRPWLWAEGEPAVRSLMLRSGLAVSDDIDLVQQVQGELLQSDEIAGIVKRLPDWETVPVRAHNHPDFAPNLLNLLADMGVQPGDIPAVERLLDQMLAHQETSGRFTAFGIGFRQTEPTWGCVLCDSHAVLESLVRFGRAEHPQVQSAIARMNADLAETAQGWGWPCLPHSATGWRGPGRKGDFCPQVTLEALRVYARMPRTVRPAHLEDAALTSLNAWRNRAYQKPYLFGHGRQFKTVKWPPVWYDVSAVLNALKGYPDLRQPAESAGALAELLACLAAYNFSPDGTVTPRSCYQGYSEFSFGQKKQPSPWATAYLCALLLMYDDLAVQARAVNVCALTSSKGGQRYSAPAKIRHRRMTQCTTV